VYVAGAKIDRGKTRAERGYGAARLAQGKRTNILRPGPGLTSAGGRVEAMYRRLLDIHPVEDSTFVAPHRGFTEKRRDSQYTFDFRRRFPHAVRIVIDNKNESKNADRV
jgi:hypothetical protein